MLVEDALGTPTSRLRGTVNVTRTWSLQRSAPTKKTVTKVAVRTISAREGQVELGMRRVPRPTWPAIATLPRPTAARAATHRSRGPPACSGLPSGPERRALAASRLLAEPRLLPGQIELEATEADGGELTQLTVRELKQRIAHRLHISPRKLMTLRWWGAVMEDEKTLVSLTLALTLTLTLTLTLILTLTLTLKP